MTECHYTLDALNVQGRSRTHYAPTLNLIMERLNALENYAGAPLSSWYGTDPRTGVHYGDPATANFAHLRISYDGSPARVYIRERVDQLRAIIGAPAFPWKYTPDTNEFDTPPHRMCGVQAAGWVEMLQAIGRNCGSGRAVYRHYWKKTVDGVVVNEWTDDDGPYSKASFDLIYENNNYNSYDTASAHYAVSFNGTVTSGFFGNFDPVVKTRESSLAITECWSEYLNGTVSDESRDWVEIEGDEYVSIVNEGTGIHTSGTHKETGDMYCYWTEDANGRLLCRVASTNMETLESIETICADVLIQHSESYGKIDGYISFTPTFNVSADGSVTPYIYSVNDARGDAGYASSLQDMIELLEIDNVKLHVNLSHLKSLVGDYGGDGTNSRSAWASAGPAEARSYTKAQIHTTYYDEPNGGGGWLLWTQPYIPTGYPDSLRG